MTGNENPEMENEMTPHKEAALKARRKDPNRPKRNTPKACEESSYHDNTTTLGCQYKTKRGKYHRKYTAVARKMQESIQVYVIKYTHDEKDYGVGKQLPGQCNINGVVTHS